MSQQGTWSCVSRSDANAFANIPIRNDNSFHKERDKNPSAERGKDDWKFSNWIPGEKKLEHFCNEHDLDHQLDVDTVDDFWCFKSVILGTVVERKTSGDFNGWSIVVRTVIRWEEQSIRKTQITIYDHKQEHTNNKPLDIQRWEEKHGKFRRNAISTRRNSRRVK
jgi:hypothetical protein